MTERATLSTGKIASEVYLMTIPRPTQMEVPSHDQA